MKTGAVRAILYLKGAMSFSPALYTFSSDLDRIWQTAVNKIVLSDSEFSEYRRILTWGVNKFQSIFFSVYWRKDKGRENKEEEVRSYWMTEENGKLLEV